MRKAITLMITAVVIYLSCTGIAISLATAQTEPPAGTPPGVVTAVQTIGAVAAVADPAALPVWVSKAIAIAFGTQGVLLLASTALMNLGAATKNATETKIGAVIGQVAWGVGAVLSHFGGQKPPMPSAPQASASNAPQPPTAAG